MALNDAFELDVPVSVPQVELEAKTLPPPPCWEGKEVLASWALTAPEDTPGFNWSGFGVGGDVIAFRSDRELLPGCYQERPVAVRGQQRAAGEFGKLDPSLSVPPEEKKRTRKAMLPPNPAVVSTAITQYLHSKLDGQARDAASCKWLVGEAWRWVADYDWTSSGYTRYMLRVCVCTAVARALMVDDVEEVLIQGSQHPRVGLSEFFKTGKDLRGWWRRWRFKGLSKKMIGRVADGRVPLEEGIFEKLERWSDECIEAMTFGLLEAPASQQGQVMWQQGGAGDDGRGSSKVEIADAVARRALNSTCPSQPVSLQ